MKRKEHKLSWGPLFCAVALLILAVFIGQDIRNIAMEIVIATISIWEFILFATSDLNG
jgi:uncharacterized integral membrane protein